jgi:Sphingosine kinase and enzymes related to eukaryotic diacylglycerol kinase
MAKHSLVLFINEKSGSNKARNYLSLSSPFQVFDNTILHIFNILSESSRKEGIKTVEYLLNNNDTVKVFIAGGDGSLIPIIEEIILEKIDLSRVHFGVLPFGTGNDFSSMFG